MNITLPEPIATYFQEKNRDNVDEVISCFSPTATVIDEGENMKMTGHDSIRQWMTGTVADYKLSTDVTKSVESEENTTVTALVSGDFPGSPIEFEYEFKTQAGKIEQLTIR